ncbi:HD-GYP domain-containing protein [Anaerosalibacter sp. Marseille-P3206]|uniref:HD-GYP domain-containing protein n=1 Tax=Anaerosalibacter sp. Marseille-P3206 TaxID=1871005 RepID=UPI000984BE4A|nr:HD-GYP domain-containing protein [Anaerosalibacter sp. Marseille-P3206]
MAIVEINDLKPGMVVNKDIDDYKTGSILVKNGTVLNRRLILLIKNLGIRQIDILDEAAYLKEHPEDNLIIKFEVLSDKVESVFSDVKIGKKVVISEVSEEVDMLIIELTKNDNILGRLRELKETDDYTFNHSMNVCMLSTMVGKWLGYNQVELKQLSLAGLFHDIGKMKISKNIINKPDKLTEEEFEIIKKHTIYGFNIISETVGISKNVALGVLQHHEREDGRGYPHGVRGDKIHEFAKIIAVCDIYDAMTSDRVYKSKQSPFLAAEHLDESSFKNLDPRITRIFLDNISNFYVGNVVKLSNGEIGEIVYIYPNKPTIPIVKVGDKFVDFLKERDIKVVDILK